MNGLEGIALDGWNSSEIDLYSNYAENKINYTYLNNQS